METVKFECAVAEAQALLQLIDLAVRQGGLNAAGAGAFWGTKIRTVLEAPPAKPNGAVRQEAPSSVQ